jgi:hypothetical protein
LDYIINTVIDRIANQEKEMSETNDVKKEKEEFDLAYECKEEARLDAMYDSMYDGDDCDD